MSLMEEARKMRQKMDGDVTRRSEDEIVGDGDDVDDDIGYEIPSPRSSGAKVERKRKKSLIFTQANFQAIFFFSSQ